MGFGIELHTAIINIKLESNHLLIYDLCDLAAFGGMVGLCIGFSILSGLEIIYWFTFRLCLEIQKRKKKKKA